ncbi:hypothetical protein [Tenacibaculum maritimum]|uniref:hypothetical protein n=1 Tax=Tenacibaculum maritimum TaxID=107401 RepID=UPI000427F43C|nr:hypothetical protein [Tenacibaculum maritimum]
MEENNIDKLFQEKLQNLAVSPRPEVWSNIERKLEKKKRVPIPIWWFLGGVAAILVVGMVLYPLYFSDIEIISLGEGEVDIVTTEQIKSKVENKFILKDEEEIIVRKEGGKDLQKEEIEAFSEGVKEDNLKEAIVYNEIESVEKRVNISKKSKAKHKPIFETNATSTEQELAQAVIVKEDIGDKIKKFVDESFSGVEKIKEVISDIDTEKDSVLDVQQKQDFIVAMAKKDSISIEKANVKKWSLAPVIAAVKSNSFSGFSLMGREFRDKETKGNSTFSYGVKVAYQLGKRWSIQSGVHLQDMSYTTNEVTLISENDNGPDGLASSPEAFLNILIENATVVSSHIGLPENAIIDHEAQLDQIVKYIEIPVEIKYTLFRGEKISTSFITGFSSLILDKSSAEVKTILFTKEIKRPTNLNVINFSGNLGLDFNYSFNENWILNVNPMFKAQINAFSGSSRGFKPYTLGVSTGFIYNF